MTRCRIGGVYAQCHIDDVYYWVKDDSIILPIDATLNMTRCRIDARSHTAMPPSAVLKYSSMSL